MFEILVTEEFCRSMAKRSRQTTTSGDLISIMLLSSPIYIKTRHSINVGRTKTLSRLFSPNYSIRRPAIKAPKKKRENIKKICRAFPKLKIGHIIDKQGKMSRHVGGQLLERQKPSHIYHSGHKRQNRSNSQVMFRVLLLPWCLNTYFSFRFFLSQHTSNP